MPLNSRQTPRFGQTPAVGRKAGTVRVIGYRHQRTLAGPTDIEGVGFITGVRVRVRLYPATVNTGLVFCRTDDPTASKIPARTSFVTDTQRRTTLGSPPHGVTLVEHLLATLAGLRVDNCTIEINGPEPPGLDGSANGYVAAIVAAGVVEQPGRRPIWAVSAPIAVSAGGATISLHPATESTNLRMSYLLDYGMIGPIPRQSWTLDVRPDEFAREVAGCRTFVTHLEADALRAQGVGKHLTPADLLVFGSRGVIDNRLRFANEPARHKILDLIGDLALCGFDLAGHVVAYRSGHALNVELARRLTALAESSSLKPANFRFPTRTAIARAA
ncbi:MAG TPA: UDP-3-O-acyl-N-acetylglucosamine deacetylase [Gemmata sp.]|nr:UDP-3-O-acyl-N-acetylglucosamine deacetylase [Gemmata sp.]